VAININDVFIQIISFDSLFEVKKLDYYSLLICYNYMKKRKNNNFKSFCFYDDRNREQKNVHKKINEKKEKGLNIFFYKYFFL
jgi:hypothetical protein